MHEQSTSTAGTPRSAPLSSTIARTGLDIAGMHQALLDLLDWIDGDVHRLVTAHSRVPALLRSRP
jgi:hypothetical protein